VTNILEKEPVPATTLSPDRPGQLERIVSKLVAKRAEDRYQSSAELQRDLADARQRLRPAFWRRLLFRR
jgi:hypothetical protein